MPRWMPGLPLGYMRAFETWNYEEVEETFGIAPARTSPRFVEWLEAADCGPGPSEQLVLDDLRNLLFDEAQNWNEDELKLFFIAPLLNLVHFKTEHYKPFTQRTLSITQGQVSAAGKVDFLLAKGKVVPKIPYFCLHEYKQENRRENDPLGQLLIGMVAAQAKNQDGGPIYGAYVSGRNWFFVLLEGDQYCRSDAFVASSADIYQVFAILKKCKKLIDRDLMASQPPRVHGQA
jgi:hypothetical protein